MESSSVGKSFACAIRGVVHAVKTQRNMRIHLAAAVAVIGAALAVRVSLADFLFLLVAIFAVLVAEMFNTAIELTIDFVSTTYHPMARIIKDVTAGAVLLVSIGAAVVGGMVFLKYFFQIV